MLFLGRPRGSGKTTLVKNKPAPILSPGGTTSVNKEVSKIIEQTRPDRAGKSRDSVSKSLERKGANVKVRQFIRGCKNSIQKWL